MIVAQRWFGMLWLPRSLPGYERRRCREILRTLPPAADPTRVVAYLCHAGLANRLRAHLVAQAYALRYGCALHAHWPRTEHFAATFADLFEALPPTPLSRGPLAFIARGEPLPPLPQTSLVVFRQDWQYIEPNELGAHTADVADEVRRRLRPRQTIIDETDRFAATMPWPAVGVHIRLGDFKQNDQALPITRFLSAVAAFDRRNSTTMPLFLASDGSPEELAPFYASLPGRIHRRCGSSDRSGNEAVGDALVDMLLLARCQHVIQTPRSSFGQVACFLGGCPGEPA